MTEADEQARRLDRIRAAALRADSDPRLLTLARGIRRRLPGDARFGDPLSTAGETPAAVVGRRMGALQAERESVAQELGFGALQVWQALSEASGRGRGSEEVTLLFTDLAGFSSWALKAGDEAAVELLRAVGTKVEAAIAAESGRIVKRLGDGVMATFLEPGQAVAAALGAREALYEIEIEGYRPQLRCGVHLGRPRKLGGDYLGVDVNVAARVAAAAKPDEVLVSDAVCAALDPGLFELGRSKRLKAAGTPRELRVCRAERATA